MNADGPAVPPLPRWASVSRRAFKVLLATYATIYMIGVGFAAVRWAQGGHFFPRPVDRDWEWHDTVFVVMLAVFAISGLMWLAGEVVRGFRERPGDPA